MLAELETATYPAMIAHQLWECPVAMRVLFVRWEGRWQGGRHRSWGLESCDCCGEAFRQLSCGSSGAMLATTS